MMEHDKIKNVIKEALEEEGIPAETEVIVKRRADVVCRINGRTYRVEVDFEDVSRGEVEEPTGFIDGSTIYPGNEQLQKEVSGIINFLRENGEASGNEIVSELFEDSNAGRKRCSRRLNKLRDHGVVECERKGMGKVWRLKNE